MTNLDTLKKQTTDLEAKLEETTEKLKSMKAEIERIENGWEMKCPYNYNDSYYYISTTGNVSPDCWCDFEGEKESFEAGNIFKTKEAARLEAKRRNLLTRFRAFRDECNKERQCSFNSEKHYFARNGNELVIQSERQATQFTRYGYFINYDDCVECLRVFGKHILKLEQMYWEED
jgi:hypothetical protein